MNFSPVVMGTMRWGSWGADLSVSEVQNLVEVSFDSGFYTFDHADIYGGYTTEKLFGDAVAAMNVNRADYRLVTKCGIQYPGGSRHYDLKTYHYSKAYILNSVDESLKNLQTDYLDLLLLHRPSPLMDPEEIAAAFGILRSSGKVLDFGVSNFSPSQFELIWSCFPFLVTNQLNISANETKTFYDGTLDQLMMKKLRPMAYSVMGDYFSNPHSEQNQRLKKILTGLCSQYDAEENQLLLAFLLKHPGGIIPVAGTSRAENIVLFKKALDIQLERTDWFRILEASAGKRVP